MTRLWQDYPEEYPEQEDVPYWQSLGCYFRLFVFIALAISMLLLGSLFVDAAGSSEVVLSYWIGTSFTRFVLPEPFEYHTEPGGMLGWKDAEDKSNDPLTRGWVLDIWNLPTCAAWQTEPFVGVILYDEITESSCDDIGGHWITGGTYVWQHTYYSEPTSTPIPTSTLPAHTDWLQFIVEHYDASGEPFNDAVDYGVEIENIGTTSYPVIGVHHYYPEENNGDHTLYVVFVDETGNLVGNTAWYRRSNDEQDWSSLVLVRGAGNVPMFSNDTLSVTINHTSYVRGLHTRHPDEDGGNTLYHHSFLVVFQRVASFPTPTPIPTATPTATPAATPAPVPTYPIEEIMPTAMQLRCGGVGDPASGIDEMHVTVFYRAASDEYSVLIVIPRSWCEAYLWSLLESINSRVNSGEYTLEFIEE